MCQSNRTAGPYPRCRTRLSHSSRTPGTPRRSASRQSAPLRCIPCGGSGTSGLSLSWAEARLWPQAWWGHPETWGADREPRVKLGLMLNLGIPSDLHPQMVPCLLRRARVSRIRWLSALVSFPAEASSGHWEGHIAIPQPPPLLHL